MIMNNTYSLGLIQSKLCKVYKKTMNKDLPFDLIFKTLASVSTIYL